MLFYEHTTGNGVVGHPGSGGSDNDRSTSSDAQQLLTLVGASKKVYTAHASAAMISAVMIRLIGLASSGLGFSALALTVSGSRSPHFGQNLSGIVQGAFSRKRFAS